MKTPHKHAELIKAWADGAEIEFYDQRYNEHRWKTCGEYPYFQPEVKFRIKPEPKPEKMTYYYVGLDGDLLHWSGLNKQNAPLRIIVDMETLKIKSAEVIE